MKFSELQKRFGNRYMVRTVAGALVVALAGGSIGGYQVYAAKDNKNSKADNKSESKSDKKDDEEDIDLKGKLIDQLSTVSSNIKTSDKDETVYVIADAQGNSQDVIVSEWLKNKEGSKELKDSTNLKDIENTKGDETFTQKGEDVTWKADGNDIYYQGKSDKETPITAKITYFLDGKEMEPEEIAGKSGKVTIRFDYTNNAKKEVKIDGKKETINVPFTVMSGMILNSSFKNVEINNGKVISDGKNNIVVGMALPGLAEDLDITEEDLKDDQEIPEFVQVTADVEEFELNMTMTVAMPLSTTALDMDSISLDKMDDTMDEMVDASSKLKKGSSKLSDGMVDLSDGIVKYTDGVKELDGYMAQLLSGTNELASKAPALVNGIGQLTAGSKTAAEGASSVNAGAASVLDATGQLAAGAVTLKDGIATVDSGVNTVLDGAKQLDGGAADLNSGASTIDAGVGKVVDAVDQLVEGDKQLVSGAASLVEGYTTKGAAEGATTLANGAAQVSAGAGTLAGGAASVSDGAGKVSEGVTALTTGIKGMLSTVGTNVEALAQEQGSLYGSQDACSAAVTAAITNLAKATGTYCSLGQFLYDINSTIAQSSQGQVPMLIHLDQSSATPYTMSEQEAATLAGVLQSQAAAIGADYSGKVAEFAQAAAAAQAAQAAVSNELANAMKYAGDTGAITALTQISSGMSGAGLTTDKLDELAGGASQVAAGAAQVSEGATTLAGGASQVAAGADSLNKGINGYKDKNGKKVMGLAEGTTKLAEGINTLASGTTQLKSALTGYNKKDGTHVTGLAEGTASLLAGTSTLKNGTKSLVNGIEGYDKKDGTHVTGLAEGTSQLATGSITLADGLNTMKSKIAGYDEADGTHVTGLVEGTASLASGLTTLSEGLSTLNDSAPALTEGITKLDSATGQLKEGTGTLVSNNGTLLDGTKKLKDGSEELADGMKEFDKKAIKKLADAYQGEIKDLVNRVKAVVEAADDYESFGGIADDQDGEVKFIIRTDAVKVDAE